MKKPSVILLGSKPGAVAALAVLIKREWCVEYVVVSPEYESYWVEKPSLREFALTRNVKVLSSQSDIPEDAKVDFVISYMYRSLVVLNTLNMAERGAINFHAGPLPEFGGWAFYNIAVLERVKEYGCTCHYMDEGFDTGPLLKVEKFTVDIELETSFSLERKAQLKMITLFLEFCDMAERGEELPLIPQEAGAMRYMHREEFERLKEIPLDADAEEIDRHARAFWYPPYLCAFMNINGNKIEIIPEIAKKEVAMKLHSNDLTELLDTIEIDLVLLGKADE